MARAGWGMGLRGTLSARQGPKKGPRSGEWGGGGGGGSRCVVYVNWGRVRWDPSPIWSGYARLH